MIKDKYLKDIKKITNKYQHKNTKIFIFGSALKKKRFGDIDIGISGNIKNSEINKLKEEFTNSTLPYFVDIVNFNKTSNKFKNNIFNNEILWIKR